MSLNTPNALNQATDILLAASRQVDLANNRLSTLHASISNCRLISRLNLADNLFTSVPPVVCTLTALTDLKFERNEVLCLLSCFTGTKVIILTPALTSLRLWLTYSVYLMY